MRRAELSEAAAFQRNTASHGRPRLLFLLQIYCSPLVFPLPTAGQSRAPMATYMTLAPFVGPKEAYERAIEESDKW